MIYIRSKDITLYPVRTPPARIKNTGWGKSHGKKGARYRPSKNSIGVGYAKYKRHKTAFEHHRPMG